MGVLDSDVLDIRDTPGSHYDVIEEGPFSTVSKTWLKIEDGKPQWVVVKSAPTYSKFSREPHDIVKELRLLSGLTHENIAKTIGSFTDNQAMLKYIYMPFYPSSLSRLLASAFFTPHPFPPPRVPDPLATALYEEEFSIITKSILVQLLSALAFLHDPQRRIANRDIKPGNVMLTKEGCAKLIDFGVAWKDEPDLDKEGDIWPEKDGRLYFEVSTGAYRAPELLFGTRNYDPIPIDLWSLGATFAEFFTPLRLVSGDEDDDDDEDASDYPDDTDAAPDAVPNFGARTSTSQGPPAFIIPKYLRVGYPGAQWKRETLFNGDRGEIGLAWSIFKIMGTPTKETWPDFEELPGAKSVTFNIVPPVPLAPLLPNLPPSEFIEQESTVMSTSTPTPLPASPPAPASILPSPPTTETIIPAASNHSSSGTTSAVSYSLAVELIGSLLTYPPQQRIPAIDALRHPWLTSDTNTPILLPAGYDLSQMPDESIRARAVHEWKDKTLEQWLEDVLPPPPSR